MWREIIFVEGGKAGQMCDGIRENDSESGYCVLQVFFNSLLSVDAMIDSPRHHPAKEY
jgi:hypothetical protein